MTGRFQSKRFVFSNNRNRESIGQVLFKNVFISNMDYLFHFKLIVSNKKGNAANGAVWALEQ